MALPAAPGSAPPPSPTPVGQGSPPGTPPAGGAGGATMPTANRGHQAAGLANVQWAVRLLEKSLPLVGAETEPGQAIMKAIQSLSKHVPAGSTSPGVENSALQQAMIQAKQEQPMISTLRSLGQGQPQPGAAPRAA